MGNYCFRRHTAVDDDDAQVLIGLARIPPRRTFTDSCGNVNEIPHVIDMSNDPENLARRAELFERYFGRAMRNGRGTEGN